MEHGAEINQAMRMWRLERFDYVIPVATGAEGIRLQLGRGPDPNRWEDAGQLDVRFADHRDSKSFVVTDVRIRLPGGLTPTRLQRFPWARWLRVAEAAHRSRGPSYPSPYPNPREGRRAYHEDWGRLSANLSLAAEEAIKGRKPEAAKLRPGRPGYPDSFYREVAEVYQSLVATGEAAPNLRMAEQWSYSRNTVAGWVKKARQLGYLPPAKKGKAG